MRLAFAGHDASVSFVHFSEEEGEQPTVQTLKMSTLPYTALCFLNDMEMCGTGHNMNMSFFRSDDNGYWYYMEDLEKKGAKKEVKAKSSFAAARNLFNKGKSSGGGGSASRGGSSRCEKPYTTHDGLVMNLNPYSPTGEEITHLSSAGLDGKIIIWNVPELTTQ